MDFEKLCMLFTMQEPYYGIILSSMNKMPSNDIDTIGVGRSGNVFNVKYNPDFMEKLSLDCAVAVLKHEVLHVALNHFSLFGDNDLYVSEDEQHIRNVAADMEVNSLISNIESFKDEIDPVLPGKYGWDKSEGTRVYYSKLKSLVEKRQQEQAQAPQKPCNGGKGGQQQNEPQDGDDSKDGNNSDNKGQDSDSGQTPNNGNTQTKSAKEIVDGGFDRHTEWPANVSREEAEMIQQQIDTMLVYAADEVEKHFGDIPGEMRIRVEKLRKKPKPVADWKRFFRRYIGNEFSEFFRKSRKRQSRRFPDAAGNRHQRKSHILVAIDTSGSVSMPEYKEFFGQIRTMTQTSDFHILECDTHIRHEYDYKGVPNMDLHGGGGTSFQPVIDYFIKHQREYEALVYFTDGWSWIPGNTPKDTLWVISSKGDQSDRDKFRVNGASVVFIPKKNS